MSMTLISTLTIEVYDSANNRTDYPVKTKTQTISEKNNDVYVFAPSDTKTVSIVNTGCEFLAIYTDNPINVNVNGLGDLAVTGYWAMVGTDIDSLILTNPSTTLTCNVNVIVGNTI
jgi:hypothetical protein